MRDTFGDRGSDPASHVTGHRFDLFAAFFSQSVKEREHGSAITTRGGPHQPAAVMIDHDGQIMLPAAVADLITMLMSPDSRSTFRRASPHTRSRIVPTVRQEQRINSPTAVFDVLTASHATWSSNERVNRLSCLAHGTRATTTP